MIYKHLPVLNEEVIQWLDPKTNENFIDCTLGGAGHSLEILRRIGPKGKLLGIDLDQTAIEIAQSKTKEFENNLIIVQDNFRNLEKIYKQDFADLPINGILIDLGASSFQFDDPERGFSFKESGPLNMNFNQEGKFKAVDIINNWQEAKLIKIFKEYGEEKFAANIAKKIVQERKLRKIATTADLVEIILNSIPAKFRNQSRIHPATKVFQALRITINDELESLRLVLPQCVSLLKAGGRLAIISFHSLEDRIVKQFFVKEQKGCICPAIFPICQCGQQARIKILTKKPLTATAEELQQNPRSRSAKLRVIEKIN